MEVASNTLIRQYFKKGWRIVPAPYRTKGPREDGWERKPYYEEGLSQLAISGNHNFTVQLGKSSQGLIDIDLDSPEGSRLARTILPHTGTIVGRNGRDTHYLYTCTDSLKSITYKDPFIEAQNKKSSENKQKEVILELRTGDNQVTMIPPSIHPDGDPILWHAFETAQAVTQRAIIARCNWLAAAILLARYYPGEGSRQDFCMHLAGTLLRCGFDTRAATAFIQAVCTDADDMDEWDEKRSTVVKSTDDALRAKEKVTGFPSLSKMLPDGVGEAVGKWLGVSTEKTNVKQALSHLGYNTTDLGNAERFRQAYSNEVRHVHVWKSDMVYDGRRWNRDNEHRTIHHRAHTVIRRIKEAAESIEDDKVREALINHALRSESKKGIDAMLDIARTLPGIVAPASLFDSEETDYLFNAANGLIDFNKLRTLPLTLPNTGEGRTPADSHVSRSQGYSRNLLWEGDTRGLYITRLSPVVYDPNATCPMWDAFMWEICDGNQEYIDYLHTLAGHSLTGNIDLRAYYVNYGSGANGKSTFAYALEYIGGDYVMNTSPETFMYKREGAQQTNNIAKLRPARAVITAEPQEGRRLDESLIKQLTGGDRVTARFLFQEEFDFYWKAKIWVSTNHKPVIRGQDSAMWVRTLLHPFTVTIPREKWIEREVMHARIRADASGILNRFIEGLHRFFMNNNKVEIPAIVKQATEEYRAEMDDIGIFLEEQCVIDVNKANPAKMNCTEAYSQYTQWCSGNNTHPRNVRAFTQSLAARGIHRESDAHGHYVYVGIEWKY